MREDFINFPPEDEIEDEVNKASDPTAPASTTEEPAGEKLEDEIEDEVNEG